MKQKLLLTLFTAAIITSTEAQKKQDRVTAYAITGAEKGSRGWNEVNLVDVTTGEVISPVYQTKSEVKRLNARTGKPIIIPNNGQSTNTYVFNGERSKSVVESENIQRIFVTRSVPAASPETHKATKVIAGNEFHEQINSARSAHSAGTETQHPQRIIIRKQNNEEIFVTRSSQTAGNEITIITNGDKTKSKTIEKIIVNRQSIKKDQPFATKSAAGAFDKKHNRFYYTPMGINQLRYIDLKAKTPTIYYFEDEAFGNVSGTGDVNNQITRMVIASDGNGYALTNNASQLIQFTTKKKAVITHLGAVTNDPSNGKFSVSSSSAYGGDMVADDAGNLYLITANRRVYKIPLETRVAVYLGSIKGLPEGFTTNGAVVEKGNNIVVTSSNSTVGYYKFDLESLQAKKITEGAVFNASDLANANLLSSKKKKEEKKNEDVKEDVLAKEAALSNAVENSIRGDLEKEHHLSVYPNPVTHSRTRLSLTDYPEGRYEVQLLDLTGKLIKKQAVQVNNKNHVFDFVLPSQIAKGTYLVRVLNEANNPMNAEKIIVQ